MTKIYCLLLFFCAFLTSLTVEGQNNTLSIQKEDTLKLTEEIRRHIKKERIQCDECSHFFVYNLVYTGNDIIEDLMKNRISSKLKFKYLEIGRSKKRTLLDAEAYIYGKNFDPIAQYSNSRTIGGRQRHIYTGPYVAEVTARLSQLQKQYTNPIIFRITFKGGILGGYYFVLSRDELKIYDYKANGWQEISKSEYIETIKEVYYPTL